MSRVSTFAKVPRNVAMLLFIKYCDLFKGKYRREKIAGGEKVNQGVEIIPTIRA